MNKLLSATTLAAVLALSGAALAQGTGAASGSGGAGQGPQGQPRDNTTTGVPLSGTTGPSTVGRQTGPMLGEEQVRHMLSMQGFSNVENVTRSGDTWHARAMRNGSPVNLTVDANSGSINSQAAAR